MYRKLFFLTSFILVFVLVGAAWAQTPDDLVLNAQYRFDSPDPCAEDVHGYDVIEVTPGATVGVYPGVLGGCYHGDIGEYHETGYGPWEETGMTDGYDYTPHVLLPAAAISDVAPGDFTYDMMIKFDEEVPANPMGHPEIDWWPWFAQTIISGWSMMMVESGTSGDEYWISDEIWYYDVGCTWQMNKDQWYHWTWSYDSVNEIMRHWVDDELVLEFSERNEFPSPTGTVQLGRGLYVFRGSIDHVRFWDGWTTTPPMPPMPPQVSNPSPEKGAVAVSGAVDLCFQPPARAIVMGGSELEGPFDFDVYFGEDRGTMSLIDTILNSDTNDVMCVDPCAGDLEFGTTYYWRVDFNDLNGVGDPVYYDERPVFSFTTWGLIIEPDPENGAEGVYPSVDPNWQNDGYASEFDAFFGDDEADVDASEEGALVGDTQGFYDIPAGDAGHEFEPGTLDFGKTFYWRVDECNTPGCVHGNVRSFSTSLCDLMDDMESYHDKNNPIADGANYNWEAYNTSGKLKPNSGGLDPGLSGAAVYLEIGDPDPDLVYEGDQSMMLNFNETTMVSWDAYTEHEYETPFNLAQFGAKSISMALLADEFFPPDFDNDMLSIRVEDNVGQFAVSVPVSMADVGVTAEQWQIWYTTISEFEDDNVNIDLTNVQFLAIMITRADNGPGAVNKIYVDLLQRCAPFCRPEATTPYDLDGDCIVSEYELGVVTENWLEADRTITPTVPSDANLLVDYTFDPCATYNNLYDSSGNAYHGVEVNVVNVHDGILTLENDLTVDVRPDDINAVKIGGGFDTNDVFNSSYTVSMEFRSDGLDYVLLSTTPADKSVDMYAANTITYYIGHGIFNSETGIGIDDDLYACAADFAGVEGTYEDTPVADGQWHTVVYTYDAETGCHDTYVDGYGEGGYAVWYDDSCFDFSLATGYTWETLIGAFNYHAQLESEEGFSLMTGDVNDLQIYNYAVTEAEAMYLVTGSTDPVEAPASEEANFYEEAGFPNEQIDFRDYAALANNWMVEQLWPAE